ncbi:MAG TPA: hypothetical protein VHL31_22110 [Geminicoccus sp.]|jgi:hypothetical protein|uniref:hypothetical protein n=1 Tax=Geminicoccus sp. TaxID=2024832 RepID=UPI002E349807|nr:hypothetical protein [Geminicoccus sp.]HEX2528976.1 hypothetical protein [Geminicoccus sp.]
MKPQPPVTRKFDSVGYSEGSRIDRRHLPQCLSRLPQEDKLLDEFLSLGRTTAIQQQNMTAIMFYIFPGKSGNRQTTDQPAFLRPAENTTDADVRRTVHPFGMTAIT